MKNRYKTRRDRVLDGINFVNNLNFVYYNFKNYFDPNINGNSLKKKR